jgi:hypothetical protein
MSEEEAPKETSETTPTEAPTPEPVTTPKAKAKVKTKKTRAKKAGTKGSSSPEASGSSGGESMPRKHGKAEKRKGPRQSKYNEERIFAVRKAHREGESATQIAKRFKMPVPTVNGMLYRYKTH